MYESATVLDYDNRKIWIKKVCKNFYLINDCPLVSENVEAFSVEEIAYLLDACYDPYVCDFDDENQVPMVYMELETGQYLLSPFHFDDDSIDDNKDVIDLDALQDARSEFNSWFDALLDKTIVYANDCRRMNMWDYYYLVEA